MYIYMLQRSAVAVFTFVGILDDGIQRGGVAATGQFLTVFRTVDIVFAVVFLIINRQLIIREFTVKVS